MGNKFGKSSWLPNVLTEHCTEKIGTTPAIIRDEFQEKDIVTKVYFSAVSEGNLLNVFQKERKQIIVTGAEAHICVQQTVLDLLELTKSPAKLGQQIF